MLRRCHFMMFACTSLSLVGTPNHFATLFFALLHRSNIAISFTLQSLYIQRRKITWNRHSGDRLYRPQKRWVLSRFCMRYSVCLKHSWGSAKRLKLSEIFFRSPLDRRVISALRYSWPRRQQFGRVVRRTQIKSIKRIAFIINATRDIDMGIPSVCLSVTLLRYCIKKA